MTSLAELKLIVDQAVDIFEPKVNIIYGGRGSGKTTALVALDVIAGERGLRSLVIVPFSDLGKHHLDTREHMAQGGVPRGARSHRSEHYFTPQRLSTIAGRGVRPEMLLIEEWGLLSEADKVRIYEYWRMWRPVYTYISVSTQVGEQAALYLARAQFDYSVLNDEDFEKAPKDTPREQVHLTPWIRPSQNHQRLW